MAQKYHEHVNYKEEQRAPRGASDAYIIIFQTIFYAFFHVSGGTGNGMWWATWC